MRLTFLIAAVAAFAIQAGESRPLAAPYLVKPDIAGSSNVIPVHNTCHQNVRTHGGSFDPHRHRQSDCRVVIVDGDGGGQGSDCHANVRRHFVPGYGSVWHRHRGNSCSVDLYEGQGEPTPGVGGCIQVGPLTVCPGH